MTKKSAKKRACQGGLLKSPSIQALDFVYIV
uniref:Uncharacterized protein n=1 Tax=Siphoviridae sp. ctf8W5 TaxID=2825595 RepID=A0A8S5Q8A5_9CAUD|nr:MAG TPA: hypothetical protein [Siphoviridae sp. ctf8W5]